MCTVSEGWGVDISDLCVVSAASARSRPARYEPSVVRIGAGRPRFHAGVEGLRDRAEAGLAEPAASQRVPRKDHRAPHRSRLLASALWTSIVGVDGRLQVQVPGRARPIKVSAAQALAAVAILGRPPDEPLALAIPDSWDESPQERLLVALRRHKGTSFLVWRPVAAALGLRHVWPKHEQSLIILDLGGTRPALTALRLVEHEGRWVPIRSRPDGQRPPRAPPLAAAVLQIGNEVLRSCDAGFDGLWNLWLGQGWLGPGIARASLGAVVEGIAPVKMLHGEGFETLSLTAHDVRRGLRQAQYRHLRFTWPDGTAGETGAIDGWLTRASRALSDPGGQLSLAVIGWAGVDPELRALQLAALYRGAAWLRRAEVLELTPEERLECVARGAAVFARDRAAGVATYFDTLPHLQLHVSRIWSTEYFDLIPNGQLVEASDIFKVAKEGLVVARNQRRLSLQVRRNDSDLPRQAVIELRPPPRTDVPLVLAAEYRPASGHAHVEVRPAQRGNSLGRRRIRVRWDEMRPDQVKATRRKKVLAWLPVAPTIEGPREDLEELVADIRDIGKRSWLPNLATLNKLRTFLGNSPGLVSSSGLPPDLGGRETRKGIEVLAKASVKHSFHLVLRRLYCEAPVWYQSRTIDRTQSATTVGEHLFDAGSCVSTRPLLLRLLEILAKYLRRIQSVTTRHVPERLHSPLRWTEWSALPRRDKILEALDALHLHSWFWCAARLFRFRQEAIHCISLEVGDALATAVGEYLAMTARRSMRTSTRREAMRFLLFLLRLRERAKSLSDLFLPRESDLATGLKTIVKLHPGINAGGENISKLLPRLIDVNFPETDLPRLLEKLGREG